MKIKIFIFVFGFICALGLLSKAMGNSTLPNNVSFSGESNVLYFFDRESAKVYRYNSQGRLTRVYIIEELGKDLKMGK